MEETLMPLVRRTLRGTGRETRPMVTVSLSSSRRRLMASAQELQAVRCAFADPRSSAERTIDRVVDRLMLKLGC